jgi:hypothetical protein
VVLVAVAVAQRVVQEQRIKVVLAVVMQLLPTGPLEVAVARQ